MNGWRAGYGLALVDAAVDAAQRAREVAGFVSHRVADFAEDGSAVLSFMTAMGAIWSDEANRIVALSASSAPLREEFPSLPSGWAEPVDAFVNALLRKIEDESLSDAVLLDALDLAIAEMPGLIEAMDVDALAETLEAGMGQAVLAKAKSRKQKAEIKALSADGEGIAFAPLAEAMAKLDRKTPVGAMLTSAQWARVPLELRERAFFSARVESIRFLAEAQEKLRMRLSMEKEALANGKSAFVDRGSFVVDMRRIAEEEGIQTTDAAGRGTVRDIRSVRRLNLIWDMQTRQAQEYARWKMDHDADVLDEFPAYRLGESTAENPRDEAFWRGRWAEAGSSVGWEGALEGDMVALKTSPIWQALSRFGTPWPPFDYGSQRDLDDVDRQEAEGLGLLDPNAPVPEFEGGSGREFDGETGEAIGFNDALEASVTGLQDDERKWLRDSFSDEIKMYKDRIAWLPNAFDGFIQKSVRDRRWNPQEGFGIGTATTSAVEKASKWMDLQGVSLRLPAGRARHFWDEHGPNSLTTMRSEPMTREDIRWLPQTWRAPVQVTFEGQKDHVVMWGRNARGNDLRLVVKKTGARAAEVISANMLPGKNPAP